MKGTLFVIQPNDLKGPSEERELFAAPGHLDINRLVGGFIEQVPFFNVFQGKACVAFCNEEGKNEGLLFNPLASLLWYRQNGLEGLTIGQDILVGPVVIIVGDRELMNAL